jgi:DNA (cytosine-5)-methyltransferase 1
MLMMEPCIIYFNEWNNYCAKWLHNLWPSAVVDGRDIREVKDDDLCSYYRVHLFAGIGGWEYALQLAGWPADETVWTGSCPCQPFSRAGKRGSQDARRGRDDERHLWPHMLELICRHLPPTIIGEQVAGKAGLEWFDGVQTNLEGLGYTCGMAVLPAACVGSPHIRERIFWLADSSWTPRDGAIVRGDARTHSRVTGQEWRNYRLIRCIGPDSDGGTRRTGTRVQPLAPRIPGDLERLLAYGNSIVPQVAAEFISAYMEVKGINACIKEDTDKVHDEQHATCTD